MKSKQVIRVITIIVSFFMLTTFLCKRTPSYGITNQTFSVLTYNVGGLPELLSSANPSVDTVKISPLLNDYDIVAVQEDFAYHSDLIKYVTHPYLTKTKGNVPFGDGMNYISKVPFNDFSRVTWNKRYGLTDNGSDQMTPKGFAYAQYELEAGVYVDIYTLHTDAGDDSGSYDARRDNIKQIAAYINTYSKGNAVIVMGDTNSRYTRVEDNFETELMQACGLSDPWIQLVRNGSIPADGDALMDGTNKNGPNYEVVDKVLYRSSKSVTLTPIQYRLEDTKFVDESGNQLSDHYPVSVQFQYAKVPGVSLSSAFGGSGGIAFNYLSSISQYKPSIVSLRAGSRVDAVSMTYSDGTKLSSGGTGGTEKNLTLATDEYVTQVKLCKGSYNGSDRIFYVGYLTNKGQTISGGTQTSSTTTFTAPSGYYIAGFFGRAESAVDKLGVIYKALP